LERVGVRIVPSRFLSRGELVGGALMVLPTDFAPDGLIVKPTVGVGAFETARVADPAPGTASRAPALSGNSYMVQPFLPAIMGDREWSFAFLAGDLAYTARKVPAEGDWRVQVMYGADTHEVDPAPADRAAAESVIAALPVEAFYARIDMVRMADGGLALIEAELIEPQLFFADIPAAAPAFAKATARLAVG
jgi:glutathione synthase/RimK-type ligase-like ATP-grasp enzyme